MLLSRVRCHAERRGERMRCKGRLWRCPGEQEPRRRLGQPFVAAAPCQLDYKGSWLARAGGDLVRELIAGASGSPRTIWERLIFKYLSDKLTSFTGSPKPSRAGRRERHSFSLDKSGKR